MAYKSNMVVIFQKFLIVALFTKKHVLLGDLLCSGISLKGNGKNDENVNFLR